RYMIYACSFFALALTCAFPKVRVPHLLGVFTTCVLAVLWSKPLVTFPWDDEAVTVWKEFTRKYPGEAQFVCSNPYQSSYYNLQAPMLCRDAIGSMNVTKPLLFFDLNNNNFLVAMALNEKMKISRYRALKHSRIIRF